MGGILTRTGSPDQRWELFSKQRTAATDHGVVPATNLISMGRQDFVAKNAVVEDGDFIEVYPHRKILVRWYGRDLANEVYTCHLLGWFKNGPGHLLGDITVTLGIRTMQEEDDSLSPGSLSQSGEISNSILSGFQITSANTYNEADTVVINNSFSGLRPAAATTDQMTHEMLQLWPQTPKPDYMQALIIDMSWMPFHWILPWVDVSGTADSAASIWIPIE